MTNRRSTLSSVIHDLQGAFGADAFGRRAEAFARLFGTPRFLTVQTIVVVVWIVMNAFAHSLRWDIYPFILLNLAFSLQAAYAAPLILLAQTRQADRDTARSAVDAEHREEVAARTIAILERSSEATADLHELLALNTRLTEEIKTLTGEIHLRVAGAV